MPGENFDPDTILRKVFDIYRIAGIFDDAIIIENIAFYALYWHFREEFGEGSILKDGERRNFIRKASDDLERVLRKLGRIDASQQTLIPSAPMEMRDDQQMDIYQLLVDIFENTKNLGEWFNFELVIRLSSSPKGGRYATPRHLLRFMAGVVKLKSDDSIADFACGTGGMLVANGAVRRATGIEISPNMARLAFANLILNGQLTNDLYLGNAFDVAIRERKIAESKFDVIAMNPPFGMSVEASLISQTFGGKVTGRSETLFAALAYAKLEPGGRMAIMVPSGVLFSNNQGEQILREMLVENRALRAVISLPRDTMQPINGLATHILFAVKPRKNLSKRDSVWFYRPRFDGFTSGRNRQPDPTHDDLPLIRSACNTPSSQDRIQVIVLRDRRKVVGYRLESDKVTNFQIKPFKKGLLVEVRETSEVIEWIFIEGNKVKRTKPKNKISFYDPAKDDQPWVENAIFKSDDNHTGIVFDLKGALIGVLVSTELISRTKSFELQPENYWPQTRPGVSKTILIHARNPAQVLADIKRKQNLMTLTIDRLLSIAEFQAVASASLPPRLKILEPPQDLFQGIQHSIWEVVKKKTESAGEYLTPTPFQVEEIKIEVGDDISLLDVQRTLDLFRRLGLIVSVAYDDSLYYRLPAERDVLKGADV